MLLWCLSGVAAVLAVMSYVVGRRVARRLEQLNHSYWELRYEYGLLRAQVARLDPEHGQPVEPEPGGPAAAFVPLSSLKR